MKKYLFIFVIMFFILCSHSYAENQRQSITLPNGQSLDITNLSNEDVNNAIKIARKSTLKEGMPVSEIGKLVSGVDPTALDGWRKLITGTIKDVCNDLSITVNDFVKTPVGIGISILIIYKVIGKDLLDNALDILVMVPLWVIFSCFNAYVAWYFLSAKTVYEKIYYNEAGKKIKEGPKRISRYPWNTKDLEPDDFSQKHLLIILLAVAETCFTLLTLLLILTT